ncbi:Piwi domain-containing protein [Trichoderma ceciliae]
MSSRGRGGYQDRGGGRGGGGYQDRGGRGGGGRGTGASSRGGRGGAPPQVFSPPGGIPAPDKTVTRTEDALLSSKAVDLSSLGLEEAFPRRPGYGKKGTEVILWANYVALTASPKLVLYRYDISVTPAAIGRKLTQIIRLLLEAPELAPYKRDIVSDFKSTLICRQEFADQTITLPYRSEGEDEPRTNTTQYNVQLRLTNNLATSELIGYLTSTNPSAQYDDKQPLIQALNIFLNHYAKSSDNIATSGSSKVFALGAQSDTWDLNNCLVAIRGFFASVRAATARVLVNVNPSHGAFFQEGPLDQFVTSLGGFQRNLFRQQTFLKGIRVRTTHLKDKLDKKGKAIPRIKTIWGFANRNDGNGLAHPPRVKAIGSGPKDVEFWLEASPQKGQPQSAASAPGRKKKGGQGAKAQGSPAAADGQYISVYDFFARTYNIRINDLRLPVVNVGNGGNPTYLPLQVCHVLPGQLSNSKLDPAQTQQMIRFAVRRPVENATSIVTKGLQTTGLSPETNPLLSQFGIDISPNLVTVLGRVLVSPKLGYGQNQQVPTFGGSWNMIPRNAPSLKFSTCGSVQKWSCVYIEMPSEYPNAYRFSSAALSDVVRSFHAVLNDTGITASVPLQPFQRLQLNDTDDPQLDALVKRAASSLQLLFVILPATPIPLYNRIKHLGDVKYGIHTICSVGTKIAKPQGQDQYLRNLALKFNLKLGGSNQLVDPTRLGFISEDKTMIVGIDVTHPSPGSSTLAPSVAGMVASVDRWLGQWPAVLSIQPKSRKEMVSELDVMLKTRLRLWRQKGRHTAFPENIIIYRDGVSEGQYQTVLDEELPLIRAACKEIYPPPDQKKGLPRLTIAIVGKRHHTRFYPTAVSDADNSGNTKAGTVVDRGVTEARNWDFFLQAHAALQGTARPAHYYVVLDEIFRPRYAKSPGKNIADEFQDLTQSMCYLFGRATKAVSYCTPAYYADILCERARCYLSRLFETPSNSAAPSVVEGSEGGNLGTGASEHDVQIHERLKDSMFYI